IFGGQIAAWCDICAAISAQRFSRGPVVTVSMDQLHFLRPVRQGMIVVFKSQVNQAWNTSMEVGVRVDAEDPTHGTMRHCCTAYLTFVALDTHGQPRGVPTLDVGEDSVAARRCNEADQRREARLKMREKRKKALKDGT
ncbi:MAG: acyl-CoA thioesterase, partial [Myxococcota bacterium]